MSDDDKNPDYTFQVTDSDILAMAARGKIDLNQIARKELSQRGLDHHGNWVGFDESNRIYEEYEARRKS